ncbi:MAG: Glyoxylase or a related metal-dependent hydrolase [Candidatus Alkanophagales archaeon MCA70_species_1]|nr:Glyoxylase or a related metal-dependent hydrolase [Candidatus Alkanophaga volatiphilum]
MVIDKPQSYKFGVKPILFGVKPIPFGVKICSGSTEVKEMARKVWQDVYVVGGPDISDMLDCCVYLIDVADGDELVLIDAGAGRSFRTLVRNIEHLGFSVSALSHVVATHAHIDHIGALARFRELGAKIVAHELDAAAIESGEGIGAEFYGVPYEPCPVDVKMSGDALELKFRKHTLKIIHIPGHTPGSVAVLADIAGRRVLFGQDIHGPYMEALGSDTRLARRSLEKLLALNADILCEGHFGIYQPASAVRRYIEGYLRRL